MAVNVPPGFAQAALRWSLAGDPEEMVTTFGVDLGDAGGNFTEAANNVARAFGSSFPADQVDADWVWRGVRLYVGQDGGSVIPYESVGFTIQGVAAGTGPVQNTAVLVRKRTARPGRQGAGRMYVPPFMLSTGSYSPAGVLTTGVVNDLQARFVGFLLKLTGAVGGFGITFGVPMVLLHGDADAPNDVTDLQVQAGLATQRRRLRK